MSLDYKRNKKYYVLSIISLIKTFPSIAPTLAPADRLARPERHAVGHGHNFRDVPESCPLTEGASFSPDRAPTKPSNGLAESQFLSGTK